MTLEELTDVYNACKRYKEGRVASASIALASPASEVTVVTEPPSVTPVPAASGGKVWEELTEEDVDYLLFDPYDARMNAPTVTAAPVVTEMVAPYTDTPGSVVSTTLATAAPPITDSDGHTVICIILRD